MLHLGPSLFKFLNKVIDPSQDGDDNGKNTKGYIMILYEFLVSHYCEKVRWALDFKNLSYQSIYLSPGPHLRAIRSMAPKTTVPVLKDGSTIIQGSGAIIRHLETRFPEKSLWLENEHENKAIDDWEAKLDLELGRPIRSLLYAILMKQKSSVMALWLQKTPWFSSQITKLMFPLLRKKLDTLYGLHEPNLSDYRYQFHSMLNDLDRAYEKAPFLVGDQFTLADLTACALMSPLIMPSQHPITWPEVPPEVQTFREQYLQRPCIKRMEAIYDAFRSRRNKS